MVEQANVPILDFLRRSGSPYASFNAVYSAPSVELLVVLSLARDFDIPKLACSVGQNSGS
jgi:hypothetical protein